MLVSLWTMIHPRTLLIQVLPTIVQLVLLLLPVLYMMLLEVCSISECLVRLNHLLINSVYST